MLEYALQDIAERIGATVADADKAIVIAGVAPLQVADAKHVSFFENKQYREQLKTTKAAAVILQAADAKYTKVPCLISATPHVAFAKLTALFAKPRQIGSGVHKSAIIGEHCQIDSTVSIGAYSIIEDGVSIGANTHIGTHCRIGRDTRIGQQGYLHAGVTIYHGCQLGDYLTVHSGTVIGADGFGFANDAGKWVKVHQLGAVTIGNHVDIGCNTCIDRGSMQDTIIGNHVIIDNQVQVAHNVEIGDGSAIAGCTAIAGSTKIGRYCMIGGSVNFNGHIDVCDKVSLVGATNVLRSIDKPGTYASATWAQPFKTWLKATSCYEALPEVSRELQKLQRAIRNMPTWAKKLLKLNG